MNCEDAVKLDRAFYNNRWQTSSVGLIERERVKVTAAAVPEKSRRILDVGCGDGRVCLEVSKKKGCSVVAFDLSTVALGHVSVPGCCGSANQLPFRDKSFDLVISTEVLEHIPEKIYSRALHEMERVAERHILITVPNCENLTENLSVCGRCSAKFHAWGHMRQYNAKILHNLFPHFRLSLIRPFGGDELCYNPFLLWVRQRLAGSWHWDELQKCYACGASDPIKARLPLLTRACDAVNGRLWAPFYKRHRWVLALYVRRW